MVVRKLILDENGENPKPHPIVIISKQEDIDNPAFAYCWGVVASHTASLVAHPDNIHLPHVPGGSRQCAFGQPTVAVCRWRERVIKADVKPEEVIGFVQLKHLEPVIAKVLELLARKRAGDVGDH